MTIRVQNTPFDIALEIEALKQENLSIGAICTFIGYVRDLSCDTSLETLTLEHYPEMTQKCLLNIEKEVRKRWDLQGVCIIHRYGELQLGDQIVLVLTASSHRKEAFESCSFIMDYLKTQAPFWKKEKSAHQKPSWVENKVTDDEACKRWSPKTPNTP